MLDHLLSSELDGLLGGGAWAEEVVTAGVYRVYRLLDPRAVHSACAPLLHLPLPLFLATTRLSVFSHHALRPCCFLLTTHIKQWSCPTLNWTLSYVVLKPIFLPVSSFHLRLLSQSQIKLTDTDGN